MKYLSIGWSSSLALGVLCAVAAHSGPASQTSPSAASAPTSAAAPVSDDDKALYTLGVLISRNLDDFVLSPAELQRVEAGIKDGFNHRASSVDLALDTPKVQALRVARLARLERKRKDEAQVYLDKAAQSPGAKRTASGLVMIPIRAGSGASPGTADQVTVSYEGKLTDGSVFDASSQRGAPATFGLSGVIPCWTEALPLMKVGGKSRIVCPADIAYGAHGSPPKIGPWATLDFEVELVAVTPAAAASGKPAASAPAPSGN